MCDFCLRLFGVKLNFHPNPSDASTLRAEESYLKAKLYSVQIAASLRPAKASHSSTKVPNVDCRLSSWGTWPGPQGVGNPDPHRHDKRDVHNTYVLAYS